MKGLKDKVQSAGESGLSFRKISQSKHLFPDMTPDEVMQKLVQAFFRGEFERDGKSLVFRDDYPPENRALLENEPIPADETGHYWLGLNNIVTQTGKGGKHYLVADRRKVDVERRDFADVFNDTEWMSYPWDGTDEGLLGIATLPLISWPDETIKLHFEEWKITRQTLDWYKHGSIASTAIDKSVVKLPKLDRTELKAFLLELKNEKGKIPAIEDAYKKTKAHFVQNHVTRKFVIAAHKELFPLLLPGPRKEAEE